MHSEREMQAPLILDACETNGKRITEVPKQKL